MKHITWSLLMVLSVLFVACSTYSEEEKKDFDKKIQKHLDKQGLSYTKTDSGLYYEMIEEGEGENIKFRDVITVNYIGSLTSGKEFDAQDSMEFRISGQIGAWQEMMLMMKKGSKANLIAPPQLGYADQKQEGIPKNSILIYEIEVLDVK